MCSELSTRERMIRAASELLEAQGYHATGLSQILEKSETPRGSLYYYFPDGKEELAAEAVARQGREIANHIRRSLAAVEDPAEAVQKFVQDMAEHVASSGCRTGGPITAVALESSASSEHLRQVCAEVYDSWRAVFAEKLEAGSYPAEQIPELATLIQTAIEGAIILSRTQRSTEPLQQVARQLGRVLSDRAG